MDPHTEQDRGYLGDTAMQSGRSRGPENEVEPAGTGCVGLGFKVASTSALLLCIVWALSPQSVAEL